MKHFIVIVMLSLFSGNLAAQDIKRMNIDPDGWKLIRLIDDTVIARVSRVEVEVTEMQLELHYYDSARFIPAFMTLVIERLSPIPSGGSCTISKVTREEVVEYIGIEDNYVGTKFLNCAFIHPPFRSIQPHHPPGNYIHVIVLLDTGETYIGGVLPHNAALKVYERTRRPDRRMSAVIHDPFNLLLSCKFCPESSS